ncbi:MAG: hypothetical protein A3K67_03180 [Euryarchaeota archaeon RBG_16_62_10]|nr:MAG: hypothetical protein A3K67_03180 [Euryarchaeota archaeon RBG_16_62_10]
MVRGRKIRGGQAFGKAVVCSCPISFLGGVDTGSGKVLDGDCRSNGLSVSGSVFCFPYGKGSTVGSYAMYQLRLNGVAPCALVNSSAEPIVATGAIIAGIPMIDGIDVSLLRTGDDARVDADGGLLELTGVTERHVVTSIVRHRGRILLLRRSNSVGSYRGQWAGVSGFIEAHESAEAAARREMDEEVGLGRARLRKHIPSQMFRDMDTVWCVHPFLFEVKDSKVRIDWEHESYEWVLPSDLGKYPTVPGLGQVIEKLLR